MNDNTEFKPMTKAEILYKFRIFGRETVRRTIWDVLKENRNIPITEAKAIKSLRVSEVRKVHELFA